MILENKSIKKENIFYIFLDFLFVFILLPKSVQMILMVIVLVWCFKKNDCKILFNKYNALFIIYGLIHITSIFVNLIMFQINDLSRIFAAFNTAFVWIISGLLMGYVQNGNFDKEKVNKAMYHNIMILIILAILMTIIKDILPIDNITLFSRSLLGEDWRYGEKTVRLTAFMEYANLIPMLFFLALPFAYEYVSKNKSKLYTIVYTILSVFPVVLSGSRAATLVTILLMLYLIPKILSTNKKMFWILECIICLLGILVLIVCHQQIITKILELLQSRQGSNNARMDIYITGIETAWNATPFLGAGIKNLLGDYPLGSHSTYIGFFYKTGILGCLVAFCGLYMIYKRIFLTKYEFLYKLCFCCLLIMFCVEDLDGANWYILLFFILVGFFIKNNSKHINITKGKT